MLEEIAAGVLTSVINGTGKWLITSVKSATRSWNVRRAAALSATFDTYRLTAAHGLALPQRTAPDAAATWLQSNAVNAVLRDLLAVRMTSGHEADVERLRGLFRRTAAEVDLLDLADTVFNWADEEICALVAKVAAGDPEAWRNAREDAFNARIVALLDSIERQHSALDGADPASVTKWSLQYRRQLRSMYASIRPPDFTHRRKIPIERLYVPPEITGVGERGSIWLSFDDLAQEIDRTVLLGDPGAGKSTAAQVLTYRWAGDPGARVPFLVTLRKFAEDNDRPQSVVEFIEERLNALHQCGAPQGTVERLLLFGDALVIFDGLDELIDTGRRLEVTDIVEQFCAQYPLAPVLVTSRLVGYDEARLDADQFTTYTIAGFDKTRTRTYVTKWFAQEDDVPEDETKRLANAFITESEQVTDLRSNPLMLSLMCVLYQGEGSLPRDRPSVYEACTELLFEKWDANRRIHVPLRARNHLKPAMQCLAYTMFVERTELTERQLITWTTNYLHEEAFDQRVDAEAAAKEFVDFCRGRAWIFSDVGTTRDGERLYQFTHRTFLEYFAARHIASVCDTPGALFLKLRPRIVRKEWTVVAELAVQITARESYQGAERFFSSLLQDRPHGESDRVHELLFLVRCLELVEPPPRAVRDLARGVMDHFTAGNPDQEVRYVPLYSLIHHAGRWHDVVMDEVVAAFEHEAATGEGARREALLWLMSLDMPAGSDGDRFWESRQREVLLRHRDAIAEAARTDDFMWIAAVQTPAYQPLLSLGEALRLRTRGPRPILKPMIYGRYHWNAVNEGIFIEFRIANPSQLVKVLRQCIDLGAWLETLDPPFFTWPNQQLPRTPLIGRVATMPALPPDAYLGAAVLAAATAEVDGPGSIRLEGGMAALNPYLARETGDLPDLPLPQRFRTLFHQWSARKVDFVERPPESRQLGNPADSLREV